MLFLTIQANTYSAAPADGKFLNTGVYNTTYLDNFRLHRYCKSKNLWEPRHPQNPCGNESLLHNPYDSAQIVENAVSTLNMFQQTDIVEELTPLACLQAYKLQYVSARGDVLVIQSETVSPPFVYTTNVDFDNTADDTGYMEYAHRTKSKEYVPLPKKIPSLSKPSIYPSYNWQCNPQLNHTCAGSHTNSGEAWQPYGRGAQCRLA